MSNKKTSGGFPLIVSAIAILICLGIGILVYAIILGDSGNFDAEGHPKNFFGIMYQGGYIVPILLGTLFTVLCFFFERLITIQKANGAGNTDKFVTKIKELISATCTWEVLLFRYLLVFF